MYKNIEDLKEVIVKNLATEIDRDYVLLELPNYRNIGDNLIWEGEEDFLSSLPFNCEYRCSMHFYEKSKISSDQIILLTGGGNFGDLWNTSQEFRRLIIRNHPLNKIIILPQTVFYHSIENAALHAEEFNKHGKILICVRDKKSEEFLKEHFFNTRIKLVPDMAFFINTQRFTRWKKEPRIDQLLMIRNDKELKDKGLILKNRNNELTYEIKDWPTYPRIKIFEKMILGAELLNIKLSKLFLRSKLLKRFVDPIFGLNPFNMKNIYIKWGVSFFTNYKYIHTTRLHGHILAILLDIPHTFYDNSYGKNYEFYVTWTKDFDLVKFEID